MGMRTSICKCTNPRMKDGLIQRFGQLYSRTMKYIEALRFTSRMWNGITNIESMIWLGVAGPCMSVHGCRSVGHTELSECDKGERHALERLDSPLDTTLPGSE